MPSTRSPGYRHHGSARDCRWPCRSPSLSFLGGFIPYIGQALTSLLAFLVALKYGTTQDVIIMGIYTIVMNVVQGSFIAPLVYGRAVSIHPAIVLLAIPAGGELAGVLGMFLAVPSSACSRRSGGTC